jgi:hypothetical protein
MALVVYLIILAGDIIFTEKMLVFLVAAIHPISVMLLLAKI